MVDLQLTERQKEVLRYIESFTKLNGYPPSIREMCIDLNISSPRGVAKHLESMERKGFIERTGVSRGIRILKRADGGERSVEEDMVKVPLIGIIAAGEAVQAIENREENIPVPLWMVQKGFDYFILRVTGNSMIDAHILNGDLVVIRKQEWADNGDIVVALIDNEYATLKRFESQGQRVRLSPSNVEMMPMVLDAHRVKVQGKLVGVLRLFQ